MSEEIVEGELVIPNNDMAQTDVPLNKRVMAMRQYHAILPRFIVAMSVSQSISEACRRIRRSTTWWFNLSDYVKTMALDLSDELASDPLLQAREIIGNGVVEAATKKMQLVNSKDERVADRASTYVLDKVLGKAATSKNTHVEVEIVGDLPWGKSHDKTDQPARLT